MNKVADRMYELCLPRLQRIEHGEAVVNNSHHAAQLMAQYAVMASVSDQQWRIISALHKRGFATAQQLGKQLKISSKVVSAQLGKLRDIHLVRSPDKKGGHWVMNSFIAKN